MKFRTDFVTNSSSTSFGAATVNGLITALTSVIGLSLVAAANEGNQSLETYPNRDFDPYKMINEDLSLDEKLKRLDKEIEAYDYEWNELKETVSQEDYDKTKQSYDEYKEYLEALKEEAEFIEYEKQVELAKEKALLEQKQDWIDRQKQDLVNVSEQIETIKATIKGYEKAGYDVTDAKSQLDMYQQIEKDIKKTLKKEKIDFKYKAKPKQEIGPCLIITENMRKINNVLETKKKKEKDAKRIKLRKRHLQEQMKAFEEEQKAHAKEAKLWNIALKFTELVQVASDFGVDALEKVTGPWGKVVKKAYVGLKGVGGGIGEAIADPDNATSHIVKGTIKGASDVAKDTVKSKYAEAGITLVSETSQEMISSYQKGESYVKAIGKGLLKTSVDVVGDAVVDKFAPDQLDIEIDNYSHDTIIKQVKLGNPTVKLALKNNFTKAFTSQVANQAKNLPKGEGVVFGDVKYEIIG
jgi:hypothetical protein